MFELAMVNESLLFESLRIYCNVFILILDVIGGLFSVIVALPIHLLYYFSVHNKW